MNVARPPRRRVRCRIEDPSPVDGLMRYVMLGSTYGSLLACIFLVRFILESPKVEVFLPLKRATQEELAGTMVPGQGHTITVAADGTILLGGNVIGEAGDLELFSLYLAVLHRRVKDKDTHPLVIRVSPQATYGRMMAVLNALAAAREKRYFVTFVGSPAADLSWKEG